MARLDWYIRANLKLSHLQLLVALDDLRSASRVAAHLHVTQSAVSKMLAAIEHGVGLALFTRTARGIEPTESGACLVRHAREILNCLGDAQAELQDINQGPFARVSLGVLPSTAATLIPQIVAFLEDKNERVTIAVREGTMELLLPILRAGQLDLVVGFLPDAAPSAETRSERLYDDPTVAVVRIGHPLAASKGLHLKQLGAYPMILPPKGSLVRDRLDRFMAAQRMHVPRRHLESVSTLTNLGVLQRTDSVGFFQSRLAQTLAAQGMLEVLPLPLPDVSMPVGLIWMANRQLPDSVQWVKEQLRNLTQE